MASNQDDRRPTQAESPAYIKRANAVWADDDLEIQPVIPGVDDVARRSRPAGTAHERSDVQLKPREETGSAYGVNKDAELRKALSRAPWNDGVRVEVVESELAERKTDGDISVCVKDGEITVSGTVPDAATSARIERTIRDVHGVGSIRNELRVRS